MGKKRQRNESHVPARIRQIVESRPLFHPSPDRPGIQIKRAVKIVLIQAELERRYRNTSDDSHE